MVDYGQNSTFRKPEVEEEVLERRLVPPYQTLEHRRLSLVLTFSITLILREQLLHSLHLLLIEAIFLIDLELRLYLCRFIHEWSKNVQNFQPIGAVSQ